MHVAIDGVDWISAFISTCVVNGPHRHTTRGWVVVAYGRTFDWIQADSTRSALVSSSLVILGLNEIIYDMSHFDLYF